MFTICLKIVDGVTTIADWPKTDAFREVDSSTRLAAVTLAATRLASVISSVIMEMARPPPSGRVATATAL